MAAGALRAAVRGVPRAPRARGRADGAAPAGGLRGARGGHRRVPGGRRAPARARKLDLRTARRRSAAAGGGERPARRRLHGLRRDRGRGGRPRAPGAAPHRTGRRAHRDRTRDVAVSVPVDAAAVAARVWLRRIARVAAFARQPDEPALLRGLHELRDLRGAVPRRFPLARLCNDADLQSRRDRRARALAALVPAVPGRGGARATAVAPLVVARPRLGRAAHLLHAGWTRPDRDDPAPRARCRRGAHLRRDRDPRVEHAPREPRRPPSQQVGAVDGLRGVDADGLRGGDLVDECGGAALPRVAADRNALGDGDAARAARRHLAREPVRYQPADLGDRDAFARGGRRARRG